MELSFSGSKTTSPRSIERLARKVDSDPALPVLIVGKKESQRYLIIARHWKAENAIHDAASASSSVRYKFQTTPNSSKKITPPVAPGLITGPFVVGDSPSRVYAVADDPKCKFTDLLQQELVSWLCDLPQSTAALPSSQGERLAACLWEYARENQALVRRIQERRTVFRSLKLGITLRSAIGRAEGYIRGALSEDQRFQLHLSADANGDLYLERLTDFLSSFTDFPELSWNQLPTSREKTYWGGNLSRLELHPRDVLIQVPRTSKVLEDNVKVLPAYLEENAGMLLLAVRKGAFRKQDILDEVARKLPDAWFVQRKGRQGPGLAGAHLNMEPARAWEDLNSYRNYAAACWSQKRGYSKGRYDYQRFNRATRLIASGFPLRS